MEGPGTCGGQTCKKQFPGERGGGLNREKVGMERKYIKIYTRSDIKFANFPL